MLYGLPEKEVEKSHKELIELHKRVILTYLVQFSLKPKVKRKFFVLYDHYINEDNILNYFYRPIPLFVESLVKGELESIKDYVQRTRK